MYKRLLVLLSVLILWLIPSKAQYYKPPDITNKTISYKLPELIIKDSLFMDRFDSLIFSSTPNLIRKGIDKYLRISIRKNKEIFVELSDVCGDLNTASKNIGYLERHDLTYIITGKNLNRLFAISEHVKSFTYTATMWKDIDITEDELPIWILKYKNRELVLCYSSTQGNVSVPMSEF